MSDKGSPGGLHIVQPPHMKVAEPVEDFNVIIDQARDILAGIREKGFIFPGGKWPDCFAIAQPQVVSHWPLRYFVLNDAPQIKEIVKEIGGLVVMNPVIEYKDKTTKFMFKDGCMSFPYRDAIKVKRYNSITVSYDIIKNIEGGILSRPSVKKVTSKVLTGYAALVFQHEIEHFNGKSLYS